MSEAQQPATGRGTTDGHASGAIPRRLAVYPAAEFRAVDGANLGDPIDEGDELVPGDSYALVRGARPRGLRLVQRPGSGRLEVGAGSGVGRPGARIVIDCCLTFMALDGTTVEALILAELDPAERQLAALWLMPFSALAERTDHALVAIDRRCGPARLAELDRISFARGTRITLASGEQRPVELIRPGDRVLTRNRGGRPVRWIAARVSRASGAFAPVILRKGALGNPRDLLLSPGQRVFVYQRRDVLGTGRREVLVPAELLVDGREVVRGDGGFVEYFDLFLDGPEIVYAEGIATATPGAELAGADPILPAALRRRLMAERARGARAVMLDESSFRTGRALDLLRQASRA